MALERLRRAIESLVRLVGVGLVGAGVLLTPAAPLYGVPVIVLGTVCVLWPQVVVELLDLAVSAV